MEELQPGSWATESAEGLRSAPCERLLTMMEQTLCTWSDGREGSDLQRLGQVLSNSVEQGEKRPDVSSLVPKQNRDDASSLIPTSLLDEYKPCRVGQRSGQCLVERLIGNFGRLESSRSKNCGQLLYAGSSCKEMPRKANGIHSVSLVQLVKVAELNTHCVGRSLELSVKLHP